MWHPGHRDNSWKIKPLTKKIGCSRKEGGPVNSETDLQFTETSLRSVTVQKIF